MGNWNSCKQNWQDALLYNSVRIMNTTGAEIGYSALVLLYVLSDCTLPRLGWAKDISCCVKHRSQRLKLHNWQRKNCAANDKMPQRASDLSGKDGISSRLSNGRQQLRGVREPRQLTEFTRHIDQSTRTQLKESHG